MQNTSDKEFPRSLNSVNLKQQIRDNTEKITERKRKKLSENNNNPV